MPELTVGFLLGFTVLLIIFLFSSDIAAHYEVCEPTKEGAKQCASYDVLSYALHKIGAAIDPYNGLITAVATAFIAWFTLSLRRSTDKLWDAGDAQRILAEKTAERKLRAYISVDPVHFDFRRSTNQAIIQCSASLKIKNAGQTPAYEVEIKPTSGLRHGHSRAI